MRGIEYPNRQFRAMVWEDPAWGERPWHVEIQVRATVDEGVRERPWSTLHHDTRNKGPVIEQFKTEKKAMKWAGEELARLRKWEKRRLANETMRAQLRGKAKVIE